MAIKKLFIFPYNGNGIEALDCIDDHEFDFSGFIDDDITKQSVKSAYRVFGRNILEKNPDAWILAVPGSPISYLEREKIIHSLAFPFEKLATVVHPNAAIGKDVKLGNNCLIMAGVVITSNAVIGNHVCILPNTVVHHDVIIGDYTLIGSNVAIAGGTKIGRNCYIGSGANLMNGIVVGDYALIGLGSNVLKDVPGQSKVAGNPARQIINSEL